MNVKLEFPCGAHLDYSKGQLLLIRGETKELVDKASEEGKENLVTKPSDSVAVSVIAVSDSDGDATNKTKSTSAVITLRHSQGMRWKIRIYHQF